MAEILGIGLTHYPGPLVPPEHWWRLLERSVTQGKLPRALFEDRASWPPDMREEWGDDAGAAAAAAHRDRLMAGFARLRAELDAFDPDFIVIWGDDQYENFRRDCVPAFCVYMFDDLVCRPYGAGVRTFMCEENVWDLPADTEMRVRGHAGGGAHLCRSLMAADFDVAYATETRHETGLAHSFNNTIVFLDYDRAGFPYPVVPFHVNCYGNQLLDTASGVAGEKSGDYSPPSPSPRRCFELGRATARCLAESPWRVALIASSSWSHATLTEKHQRLYPDLPADRARFAELESGGFARWGELDLADIEDAGQNELLNWVCLAGAMAELGRKFETIDFIESHLFNSSKCFGLFRP